MDNGQKTPGGHPDFHSYVKIQRVFISQTSFWLTLFYSTLLALTHRRNHRWRNKYTCCAWAGGTESQFVVERKVIRDLYNTSLKFNIRVKIL